MVSLKALLHSNRILMPLILLLFGILAVGLTGYLLTQEKNVVVAKKGELAKLQKDLTLLDKILVEQQANAERVEAVAGTLPATFEEVAFAISQLEIVAVRNGQIFETKIEATATPEQNDLSSIKITLKTEGSYSGFSTMLSDLAHLPYHTRIDALKIEQTGPQVSALTNLRLYLGREGTE